MDEPLRLVAGSSGEETSAVGEPLSFEVFFEDEARTLFRRLCTMTGNSAEAEEIMQDAFLALWERWDRVGSMEDPIGYLYRTAMNVFRKRRRRAVLAVRRALSLAPDPAPFSEIDEQQDLVAALAELTPRQRAALVLTDVLDYSSEEAGRTLGITAGTVRGLAILFHLPRGREPEVWDLWSVPVTGGHPTLVRRNAGFGAYSPDGGSLAFLSPVRGDFTGAGLWVVDASGGKPRSLVDGRAITWPRWSPDGTRIAYAQGRDVYVVDVATSRARKVTRGGAPQWFDDDTLIVSRG